MRSSASPPRVPYSKRARRFGRCAPVGLLVLCTVSAGSRIQAAPIDSSTQSLPPSPIVHVTVQGLGTWTFEAGSPAVPLVVSGPQTLNLSWTAEAGHYGGTIQAQRYGWNIRNPGNDEEWGVSWTPIRTSPVERSVNVGSHRFFLEVRDGAGASTLALIEITVLPVALEAATWSDLRLRYR